MLNLVHADGAATYTGLEQALREGTVDNGSRQSGIWVLDQFTRWQSLNWDYSGRLQKAQMDVADLVPDEGFRLAD